jgi:hypothetical protein
MSRHEYEYLTGVLYHGSVWALLVEMGWKTHVVDAE